MKNCSIFNSFWRFYVLGFLILLQPLIGLGQTCVAPDPAFSTSSTDALCLGAGTVTVSNVTGGSGAYEYQLINPTNSGLNKPWQTSSTFISVSSGTYEAQVRSVCTSGTSVISSVVTQPVTVGGNYQTLELSVSVTPTCTDGTITVTATKGYLEPGSSYRYALVPSLTEPEPISSYVRAPQSSNVFTGLTPGTYYVRVYDDCSNYTSYRTIDANVYTTSNTNIGFDIQRFVTSCTSEYFQVNTYYAPPGTFSVVYPDGSEEALRTSGRDTIPITADKFNTSPANFSLKFVDQCGVERLFPYVYDSLQLNFYATKNPFAINSSCDSTQFQVYSRWASAYWPNLSSTLVTYSIDNGPIRTYSGFYLPNDGSPHQIIVTGCNRTDTLTVQAAEPFATVIEASEYNFQICEGLTGLDLRSSDSTRFKVLFLTAPEEQDIFALWDNTNYYYHQYRGILPGTYTIAVYNDCFSDTLTVTLSHPSQQSITLTETAICAQGMAVVNVSISTNTILPPSNYFSTVDSYRISVYNTSTNTLVAQNNSGVNVLSTDTTFVLGYQYTLPTGTYRIGMERFNFTGYCPIEADTITIKGAEPITLDQLLATSFCPTEGFTVVQAAGGVGPYQYTLYENTIDPSNKLAGPQDGNAFTGLDPNKIYHVAATDQCGAGINIQTQFSTVPITTVLNSDSKDCLDSPVQLEVYSLPRATYQWYKDNVAISGATDPVYIIPALTDADLGTYKVFVTVGTCDDFTTDLILTGTECTTFPVKLSAFNATKEGTSTLLQWSTTLEDHSDRFEVQYSRDARNWVTEGSVQAKGSSTATTHYTYSHWSPQNGNNYYRLKMIDQDGSWALSSIKNVRFELAPSISIYPNPAVDKIRLAGTDLKNITGIVIYDLTGRELLRTGFLDGLINVKQLAAGTYIVQVNYQNGLTNSQKLVVIR